jgi:hypothetical protein
LAQAALVKVELQHLQEIPVIVQHLAALHLLAAVAAETTKQSVEVAALVVVEDGLHSQAELVTHLARRLLKEATEEPAQPALQITAAAVAAVPLLSAQMAQPLLVATEARAPHLAFPALA